MIKYEFMRAHGKGLEGTEKRGGVRIKKEGAKKGDCAAPPFFQKGGCEKKLRRPPSPALEKRYVRPMTVMAFFWIFW